MRRQLITLCLVICLGFVQAQEQTQNDKYDFQNWRVLFQMNGPNNWNAGINFVKPISAKWVIRFGVSPIVSYNRTIGDNPDPSTFLNYDDRSKNKKFGANLSLGTEFHFISKGKLDPYLFFGTGLGGFIEINDRSTSLEYNTALPSGLVRTEREQRSKSAPQLNINPFLGFGLNYYFHERVAFGIEYSCSPNMTLIKGTGSTNTDEQLSFEDGSQINVNSKVENNQNAFFVQANPQIGFHLIYVLRGE